MRRDGRKLDHKTLEEIRRMAVERVWEGEDPSEVIASYGFSRTSIYKWLQAAKGRRGLATLLSRRGTGRLRNSTNRNSSRSFVGLTAKTRDSMGLILVCGRVV